MLCFLTVRDSCVVHACVCERRGVREREKEEVSETVLPAHLPLEFPVAIGLAVFFIYY